MYDIAIIGAGPAGSTLARILDKKYNVVIIDQRNLDKSFGFQKNKCCGGLLAPAAQRALSKQGLGLPHEILAGPQTFSVKSLDIDNDIVRYYQRHYINIDREKFDRWLMSLVPDSVDKHFACIYKQYTLQGNHYRIFLEDSDKAYEVEAKVLIGADGALSRVREQAFKGHKMPKKYVSIQEHFETSGDLPYYVSIFDKSITDFYSWIIQKDGKLLVGTAVPEKLNANERYETLIRKLKAKDYIKGNAVKKTGTLIMRTRYLNQLCYYSENVALVGEAAGFISPSSAEGISYALESAVILGDVLNCGISGFGLKYKKELSQLRLNLLLKNFKSMLMYIPFIRKLIMKSGILAIKNGSEK